MPVPKQTNHRSSSRLARLRRRHPALTALAAFAAATALAGCVVVPARPAYYRPVPVRPHAYVVF
ncbi:MAG: hypothetical protein ACREFP_23905 [Acetobacteraceae bacterium]